VARALPLEVRTIKARTATVAMTMMEDVMDHIAQANIDRFSRLLETETDPAKRIMIARLLAEERAKQSSSEAGPLTDVTC
jgi:hypothetical protein